MQAFAPLVSIEKMERVLGHYGKLYTEHYLYLMRRKLGLESQEKGDMELLRHLLGVLQALRVDYTLFFRTLSRYEGNREALLRLGLYHEPMNDWLESYDKRLRKNASTAEERHFEMLKINPKYVLKNYMLQEAIDAADEGDFAMIEDLFAIAQNPYEEHPAFEDWAAATPEALKNRKLSCSS
jgi:uncharacterized protein YdiU (UPF0061 family)